MPTPTMRMVRSAAPALSAKCAYWPVQLERRQRRVQEVLERVEAAQPRRHPDEAADDGERGQHVERHQLPPARPARDLGVALAEEDEPDEAERVQRGDEGADQRAHVEPDAAVHRAEARGDDEVLAVEAVGDERQRRKGGGADGEGPEHGGQLAAEPAHLEDVVLVGERLDDHAGAEEEQGLEEGVRHEVEHARLPAGHAERQEHVADLADGRVGERALEVVLHERAEAGQQQRHGADDGDDQPGVRRERRRARWCARSGRRRR